MNYDTYGSSAVELAIELANAERDAPEWAVAFLASHDDWFTPGTSLDLSKDGEQFACVRQIQIKLDHITGRITYWVSKRHCHDLGPA